MFADAVGLALLAALTPTALLAVVIYLGSQRPRAAMTVFLAGSLTMSGLFAIVVLLALRGGGLSLPHNHAPRYGLRLGLGLLALAAGVFLARRARRPADPSRKKPALVTRLMTRPGHRAAFLTGLVCFLPSAQFVAAVQVIATAHASPVATALALLAVVFIDVIFVWLPFVLYLARPEATARRLRAFNTWLRARGTAIAAAAVLAAGLILTANGLSGLV